MDKIKQQFMEYAIDKKLDYDIHFNKNNTPIWVSPEPRFEDVVEFMKDFKAERIVSGNKEFKVNIKSMSIEDIKSDPSHPNHAFANQVFGREITSEDAEKFREENYIESEWTAWRNPSKGTRYDMHIDEFAAKFANSILEKKTPDN